MKGVSSRHSYDLEKILGLQKEANKQLDQMLNEKLKNPRKQRSSMHESSTEADKIQEKADICDEQVISDKSSRRSGRSYR